MIRIILLSTMYLILSNISSAALAASSISEIKQYTEKLCYTFSEPRKYMQPDYIDKSFRKIDGITVLGQEVEDTYKDRYKICNLNLLGAAEFAARVHFGGLELTLNPFKDNSYVIHAFMTAEWDECTLTSITIFGIKNTKGYDLYTKMELCKVDGKIKLITNDVSHQRYMKLTSDEDEDD